MFKRCLSIPRPSPGLNDCPSIWEMDNGDLVVIGIRKTDLLRAALPEAASCGPDEEMIVISKNILEEATDAIQS